MEFQPCQSWWIDAEVSPAPQLAGPRAGSAVRARQGDLSVPLASAGDELLENKS